MPRWNCCLDTPSYPSCAVEQSALEAGLPLPVSFMLGFFPFFFLFPKAFVKSTFRTLEYVSGEGAWSSRGFVRSPSRRHLAWMVLASNVLRLLWRWAEDHTVALVEGCIGNARHAYISKTAKDVDNQSSRSLKMASTHDRTLCLFAVLDFCWPLRHQTSTLIREMAGGWAMSFWLAFSLSRLQSPAKCRVHENWPSSSQF